LVLVRCKTVEAGNVVALPLQASAADGWLQQADPEFYQGHSTSLHLKSNRSIILYYFLAHW
jgi:hypothetical protein